MAALGYSAHVATSEAELRAAVRAWVDRTEHSQPWFLEVLLRVPLWHCQMEP